MEVRVGSYIFIYIFLIIVYVLLGVVLDDVGNFVGGLWVEVIFCSGEGVKILLIINGVGIYYLEFFGFGEYDLFINGVLV